MADPLNWNGTIAKRDLENGMDRLAGTRVNTLEFMALKRTDPLELYAKLSLVLYEVGIALDYMRDVLDIMNGDKSVGDFGELVDDEN